MPRTARSRTSQTSVLAAKAAGADEENLPRKRKVKEAAPKMPAEPSKKKATAKTSPASKKPRGSATKSNTDELPEEPEGQGTKKAKSPRKKSEPTGASPKKSQSVRETATETDRNDDTVEEVDNGFDEKEAKKPKRKKASDHQRITERDPLPRLWDSQAAAASSGSYTFRIASWNVAGLRALLNKFPTALIDLCQEHDLDMLCLQETKLQDAHLDDPNLNLRGCVPAYDDYWSCSKAKKGYSGTAVFIKSRGAQKTKKQANIASFFGKKSKDGAEATNPESTQVSNVDAELVTPSDVAYHIGKPIDDEGRTIILEFPFATVTNVYVPNSGQTLQRLDYRTNEWDKDFLAFQQKKEKDRDLPVIWLGDLNIAHKAFDVWNDGASHLAKQAGVTEQERLSFQEQLDAGFVDAFRKLHPSAKGHYSYWSQRSGNREPNKGLRLDYFICSPGLFSEDSPSVVRDSYMIPERLGSDHSPVVLEIELKPKK